MRLCAGALSLHEAGLGCAQRRGRGLVALRQEDWAGLRRGAGPNPIRIGCRTALPDVLAPNPTAPARCEAGRPGRGGAGKLLCLTVPGH